MSERSDELLACLEVLSEYVDSTPEDDPDIYNSEFLTACWQTCELTLALLQEHNDLLARVRDFTVAYHAQQQQEKKVGLVVAAAGDIQRLTRGRS